jgi:hypothetical protein
VKKPATKEAAVAELLDVSRKLLSSTKIFHLAKIQELTKRRTELVAFIWDIPENESLLSFSEKFGIYPPSGLSIRAKDREELQVLDRELRNVMNHHLNRLKSESDMLDKGERMMNKVRNVYSKREISRFNRLV